MASNDQPATTPPPSDRRKLWRRILWLLILVPLLPMVFILLIAGAADLKGCMADPMADCGLGPLSLGRAFAVSVDLALMAGSAFVVLSPLWIGFCCLAAHRSLQRTGARILITFLIAFFLGFLPFLGPALAMGGLVHPGCQPNEGGVGPCTMFAVDIGKPVHELATLPWMILIAPTFTFGAWLVYVIVLVVMKVTGRPREASAGG